VSVLFDAGVTPRPVHVGAAGGTVSFTGNFRNSSVVRRTGAGLMRVVGGAATLEGGVEFSAGTSVMQPANTAFLSTVSPLTVGVSGGGSTALAQVISDDPTASLGGVDVTVHPGSILQFTRPTAVTGTLRLRNLTRWGTGGLDYGAATTLSFSGNVVLRNNNPSGAMTLNAAVIDLGNAVRDWAVDFEAPAPVGGIDVVSAARFVSGTAGGIRKLGSGKLLLDPAPGSTIGRLDVDAGTVITTAPLVRNGGTVRVGNLAELRADTPLSAPTSPVAITMEDYATLEVTTTGVQRVSSLSMKSSRLTMFSGGDLELTGNAVFSPTDSTFGSELGNGSFASSLILPPSGVTEFLVATAVVPAGGVEADMMLRMSVQTGTNVLRKTGPGSMSWRHTDLFWNNGGIDVREGLFVLERFGTFGTRFTANLAAGGEPGKTAIAVVNNDALQLTASSLTTRVGGTIRLMTSMSTGSVVVGGTITSSGSVLTMAGVLSGFFESPVVPLLDSDLATVDPVLRVDMPQPPAGMADQVAVTRRILGVPTLELSIRGDEFAPLARSGGLRFVGSVAGAVTPGPVRISLGATMTLERAVTGGALIVGDVTVVDRFSELRVVSANALAAGVDVRVEDGAEVLLAPVPGGVSVVAVDGVGLVMTGGPGEVSRLGLASATVGLAGRTFAPVVARLSGLSVEDDGAALEVRSYFGRIDMGGNDLVVTGGDLSLMRDLARAWLVSGGANGLGTSVGVPHTRVGVVGNVDESGFARFASFDGLAVGPADVLAVFSWTGDTNLDGVLDASDFNAVLNGLTNNLTGWENGDINYDGVVNAGDWSLFLPAYSFYLSSGTPLQRANPPVGSIPEPGTLALVLPVAALLRRTRTRRTA
jgi:hypothetical protein